jgi:hypothetical protein
MSTDVVEVPVLPVVEMPLEPAPVVEPVADPVIKPESDPDLQIPDPPAARESVPVVPGLRYITSHDVNGLNHSLAVEVMDEPGAGGACRHYRISKGVTEGPLVALCEIKFQDGMPSEVGINGISNEALLAIVQDRLIGFQSTKYATEDTATALNKLTSAIKWLHRRTQLRTQRGVEGTSKV